MSEEEKKIQSFKRYIISQENKLEEYYKLDDSDDSYYKDEIQELELTISLLKYILNLIEKQQKEIENIKQYAEWHISHLTEDIKDYIDDDKNGNADIIAELEEQREHWKDIIRITKNEKIYIDYKD